jgi:chemotaxis protein methyltransferase WspC
MIQAAIENLLRQKIGLNATAVGSNTIARAMRHRMTATGLADEATYLTQLYASATELEALIETIVVPETWFFRDREPFVLLAHYVTSEWLPAHPHRVLRVLSLPCSTGEEPYSIAIALLEAGLGEHQFQIDAVDISQKALAKAQQAIYDEYSFRGKAAIGPQLETTGQERNSFLKTRYFQRVANEYQLHDSVRRTVNFIQENVLEPQLLVDKSNYDVIFCRNLLIYLDQAARIQTVHRLDHLLAKNGLFFVGHSEMGQIPPARFSPVRHALAFAFRKVDAASADSVPIAGTWSQRSLGRSEAQPSRKKISASLQAGERIRPKNKTEMAPPSAPAPSEVVEPQPQAPTLSLNMAQALADKGHLSEAVLACETFLHHDPSCAEAYCLLGQLYQAREQEVEAEQCFRKAVYLQPQHEEALLHLVLLKEQSGDLAMASVLRQRLQRIQVSQA